MKSSLFFASTVGIASGYDIILEDFSSPQHVWQQKNDPVMGGLSTGTFTIENGRGIEDGEVVDVPALSAPGFIKVVTADSGFPDISSCTAFGITVAGTSEYDGYRFSVGNARPPAGTGAGFFTSGHKAPFFINEETTATIPFSAFSNAWSDATGDILVECADDERLCLTEEVLRDVQNMQVWGEGRGGKVHLEIEKIVASGCTGDVAVKSTPSLRQQQQSRREFPTLGENLCVADVQKNLRYNMSTVGVDAVNDLPYAVAPGATLAEAICCDSAFEPFAEPSYTFMRGDVNLFEEMEQYMDADGTVTFYDSVCGIPLYRAPVGRTFAEFKEDTIEHFWPSFRSAEIIEGNTYVREGTDYVFSKCGTHLGSELPEDSPWGRERHCIDTVCVAGNPLSGLSLKKK